MREISTELIKNTVAELCIIANKTLPCDMALKIQQAKNSEEMPLAKSIMSDICENLEAAKKLDLPICQDTGMAVVFVEIGQDLHIVGDNFEDAINDGVALGYEKGLLRKSVVGDPLCRVNTENNTPAIIHTRIVKGDKITITVAPKGFGSENMSGIRMLTPSAGRQGVIDAVLEIVKAAGSNPCPPIVVGVGIGGDFEQCALLSKKALCRSTETPNSNPFYEQLEKELLSKINELNIGPQGFGGKTTALAVNIETAPTHIAGLPVAVNIGCHVTRHATKII
ncbi:MAG: fumarate hydratase [Acutalibacteraceae bacterium]|nr:fumarate hydratase [Acutalibacteraceae bacterium]